MDTFPPNTLGFDACVDCSRVMSGLKAQLGMNFIMRYAVPGAANAWKTITPAEAVTCAILGIAVAPVWESTAGRARQGADAGAADGAAELAYLPKIGMMPDMGVIAYPTSDEDTSGAQYPAEAAYYAAFGKALGAGYGLGAYASGYTINRLFADKIIKARWETQSMGFPGSKEAAAAGDFEIIQRLPANITVNGATINIDPDSLKSPTTDIGARVPWNGAVPHGAPLNIASIQELLNNATRIAGGMATDPDAILTVDDVSGNKTNAALVAWLAANKFSSLEWGGAIEVLLKAAGISVYRAAAA